MAAYYNEIDPHAAQWLRNLIEAGHIAPGIVDERDIREVKPDELRQYTQCHFFAGIGVWSLALRQAGWPDDKPVWTGSCPCQPFSSAGGKAGFADERHLWPHWFHLITQCRPETVFGEQVASKDGLGWLDLVQTDLEGAGYANAAVDLCAAGVGAPHIRQRLWFVAERLGDPIDTGLEGYAGNGYRTTGREESVGSATTAGGYGRLADTKHKQPQGGVPRPGADSETQGGRETAEPTGYCEANRCGLADSQSERREVQHPEDIWPTDAQINLSTDSGDLPTDRQLKPAGEHPSPTNGFWRDADWLFCRDGKWRPVRPGTFPLVDGAPARVGRLRAYGNAINAEVATLFIKSYLSIIPTANKELGNETN